MQVSSLDHVNIVTRDLTATVAFYQSVLGLAEGEPPPLPADYVVRWLVDAAGHPIFHLQQFNASRHGPEMLAEPAGALDHVALQCTGFAEMVARCAALELPHRVNEMADLPLRQVFLTDPNGIVLELNFRE